jgi:hypothetical protein
MTPDKLLVSSLGEIFTTEIIFCNPVSAFGRRFIDRGLYCEDVFGPYKITLTKTEHDEVKRIDFGSMKTGFGHYQLSFPVINTSLISQYIDELSVLTEHLYDFDWNDLHKGYIYISSSDGHISTHTPDGFNPFRQFHYLGLALIKIFSYIRKKLYENDIFTKEKSSPKLFELVTLIKNMDEDCYMSNPFIIDSIPIIHPKYRTFLTTVFDSQSINCKNIYGPRYTINDVYKSVMNQNMRVRQMLSTNDLIGNKLEGFRESHRTLELYRLQEKIDSLFEHPELESHL